MAQHAPLLAAVLLDKSPSETSNRIVKAGSQAASAQGSKTILSGAGQVSNALKYMICTCHCFTSA